VKCTIKIKHAFWFLLLFIASLNGCNQPEAGRVNVGYGAWNISSVEVTDVKVTGFFSKHRLNAYPHMTPSMGSNVFLDKDVTHIIPEEVQVSWRETPVEGEQWYDSKQVGPYSVKLRSRIPDDVISKASKTKYILNIGLSVGKLPILVCWRLVRSVHPKPGTVYVQQGGDC